jgi:hypothetical protein
MAMKNLYVKSLMIIFIIFSNLSFSQSNNGRNNSKNEKNNIIRINNPDKKIISDDENWDNIFTSGNSINGCGTTIAINGNDIYVGGKFSKAAGLIADNIAKWNDNTGWSNVGEGFPYLMTRLTCIDNLIYAGGEFGPHYGVQGAYISIWNGNKWSIPSVGADNIVASFAKYGNNVLVGGSFVNIGGLVANRLAIWNNALGKWTKFGSNIDNDVDEIAVDGDDIYIGGSFTHINNSIFNYIAKWDYKTQNWVSLGQGANAVIYTITIHGDNIYFGGRFTSIGNISANRIAVWNKRTNVWSSMNNGVSGDDVLVSRIVIKGNDVYVAGDFISAGGISANNIARWDETTSTWYPLGSGLTGGSARGMEISNDNLYVTGYFTTAGGKPSYYFARYRLPGSAPNKPTLIYPNNNETISLQNPVFKWNDYGSGTYFRIQVSTTSDFLHLVYDKNSVLNSYFPSDNLSLGATYYWRVCATNIFGVSEWSDVWSFKVEKSTFGLSRVILSLPLNNSTNITMYTQLIWLPLAGATSYHLQLALDPGYSELMIDEYNITPAYFQITRLLSNMKYYWRVRATNGREWSMWSEEWNFTTKVVSGIEGQTEPGEYIICNNYPNPFNPKTNISFELPVSNYVILKIYDIRGREIKTLVDQYKPAGKSTVEWMPENIPSGIYYYKIAAGDKFKMGRMVYMK